MYSLGRYKQLNPNHSIYLMWIIVLFEESLVLFTPNAPATAHLAGF